MRFAPLRCLRVGDSAPQQLLRSASANRARPVVLGEKDRRAAAAEAGLVFQWIRSKLHRLSRDRRRNRACSDVVARRAHPMARKVSKPSDCSKEDVSRWIARFFSSGGSSTAKSRDKTQPASGQCPALSRLGRGRLHADEPSTRNVMDASDPRHGYAGSDKLFRGDHLQPDGVFPRNSKIRSGLLVRPE